MTMRERWAASFPPSKELWILESDRRTDTILLESKDKVSAQESDPERHPSPIFHVWQGGDRWLYCGPNYLDAYTLYQKTIEKNTAD